MSISAKIDAIQNLQASHNIISTLEQSKASIEQLVDELPDALFIFDANGVIHKANLEACRLLKVDSEDYIGSNVKTVFDTTSNNIIFSKIHMILQNPKQFKNAHKFELQVQTDKNGFQPYYWALRPLVAHKYDKIPLIVLYGRSLAEISSFERELSEIYSSIPIGIMSIGSEGKIESNYTHYCEYLLQHPSFTGIDKGFANLGVIELLFQPAFGSLKLNEIEACKLLARAVGESVISFESIRTQLPHLLRRQIGDGELWLKIDYHAIARDGIVERILFIIENRTDLIREREDRNIWIKRNEAGVRRILEIQNADSVVLESICNDLEAIVPDLDAALELEDYKRFSAAITKIKQLADQAGFLTLKSMVEDLETKLLDGFGDNSIHKLNIPSREFSQIRLECTELIKIFHTINPQDQTSKESPQKIDPTLAKNILTGLEEASNSIDLGASSVTKKLLKNLRNIILQANSIELSTLETHLIQLTSLQTDQSPNKVKISFDWDGILIPKDSANALQSILATFIKNSINLNTRISIQHQDAKELVSNNILIKARTLEIGVEFSLIGDQWIIQKNPELTHFFESFKIDNIQLISSPKPGIRLQFQLKYNPQKSTHKI